MRNLHTAMLGAGALAAMEAMRAGMERDVLEANHGKLPVETATVEVAEEPAPKPLESLPDSHPDWRVNHAALDPIARQSPLPTRQQRRSAQKALARGLATTGKMKEREERLLEKKRRRADEAAARYDRIRNHVPSAPKA
jgi:hypothetical protein